MLWERFIGPILKAMRTLVIRHLQGYGNTAPLRYPDTWARKPDCLHLPYSRALRILPEIEKMTFFLCLPNRCKIVAFFICFSRSKVELQKIKKN